MIFYITSNTYQQIISKSIQEANEILVGGECSNEFFLLKYLKENIKNFSETDKIIVDITALQDSDSEIVQAFEMLRIMASDLQIIVLATDRYEGDELLTKFFQMSIYDIIVSNDFLEIAEELVICLKEGKRYKDALRFKDYKPLDKLIAKNEIKKEANKVLVGIAGTEHRIGVTHNSIVLANYLRARGYIVAVVNFNDNTHYKSIAESYDESISKKEYFTIKGVDYYFNSNCDNIGKILGKTYNFIVVDFGTYQDCDRMIFNTSDIRIVIAGSKPWELEHVNALFDSAEEEELVRYQYCFNFVKKENRNTIQEGMERLGQVHFLNYTEDPFESSDFADAEIIFNEYLPNKIEVKEKVTLVALLRRKIG